MSRGSEQDDDQFDSLLRQVAHLDDSQRPRLPRPGQIISGKYRIEERIGEGGMGAVFRASHLVSHKPVAIKWMLRSTSDDHVRKRFLREARVAGRVDHPNVVDVYDVDEDADGGYLVMELLNGEALRARLARGRLEVAEAVDLLLPAMRGVAAVHRVGVVHRDLKPDNIFLCRGQDGAAREAKVLDFGVSVLSAREGEDLTLTADGAVLGTLAYMSPEQLQRASDVDARSDLYSLGVILYEALTGRVPFEADSFPGLALAIVHAAPRPPSELRPDLPRELERVVLRALAKAREQRYPSVDDLIAALAPFGGGAAADAQGRASGVGHGRRSRARWPLVACAVAALGGAGFWLFERDQNAASALSAARPPPARAAVTATPAAAAAPPPAEAQEPSAQPQRPTSAPLPAHTTAPRPVQATRPARRAITPRAAGLGEPQAQPQGAAVEALEPPRSGVLSLDEL